MNGRVDVGRIRFTERLRLEPVVLAHAEDLWRLHQDRAVAEWHGGEWTVELARRKAEMLCHSWVSRGVGKWIAYHRETQELVGRGGLSRIELDNEDVLEVGWTIRSELWGCGYATEIGSAALAVAFEELAAGRVIAFTEIHNTRSRAVMKRLGMRYLREFKGEGLVEGHLGVRDDADFVLYELLHSA